jgi:hypothetical protein
MEARGWDQVQQPGPEGRRLRGFLPFTFWKGSSMSWSAGGWVASKGAWGCTMTTFGVAVMDTMSSLLSSSCTRRASLKQRSSSTSSRARSFLTSCVSAAIWALIRVRTSSRVGWVAGAIVDIVVEPFEKSEHLSLHSTLTPNNRFHDHSEHTRQITSVSHESKIRTRRPDG